MVTRAVKQEAVEHLTEMTWDDVTLDVLREMKADQAEKVLDSYELDKFEKLWLLQCLYIYRDGDGNAWEPITYFFFETIHQYFKGSDEGQPMTPDGFLKKELEYCVSFWNRQVELSRRIYREHPELITGAEAA